MNKAARVSSTCWKRGTLTWLSSAAVCLFIFSCAQGGGVQVAEGGTGGAGIGGGGTGGEPAPAEVCGDGVINGTEQCDGIELGGTTCGTLGEGTGLLSCTQTCTFDLTMCSGATVAAAGYGGSG